MAHVPDMITYAILTVKLCKEGTPKDAIRLLDEIFKNGLASTMNIATFVTNSLSKDIAETHHERFESDWVAIVKCGGTLEIIYVRWYNLSGTGLVPELDVVIWVELT